MSTSRILSSFGCASVLLFLLAVSPFALRAQATFSNSTPIVINSPVQHTNPTTAATYPSTINVKGMSGNITKVTITLDGLIRMPLENLDMLLVSPSGSKYVFLADANVSGQAEDDLILTLDDDASAAIPTSGLIRSGSFKPTSGDGIADVFPAPAPAGPYAQPAADTFASVFNGQSPNGTWQLFAVSDDSFGSFGAIDLGWSLSISTGGPAQVFANTNYLSILDHWRPADPYGTSINVAGLTGKISSLRVSLNGLSHTHPAAMDVLLVSPNGTSINILSDRGGSSSISNVDLTFDDAALSYVGFPIVSGTFRPSDSDVLADFFPSPAPNLRSYFGGSFPLSSFNGFSPNGEWKLYVMNTFVASSGSIQGGWSLEVTTTPLTPPTPPACSGTSFQTRTEAAGAGPSGLAVEDLNNDGILDLAIANQVSNDISIRIGVGDGTFINMPNVVAASNPYAIVAGKFNADNFFDLAVVNSGSNNVSILIGDGTGGFAAPVNYFVGPSPIAIAAGDINSDGKPDLAVANFGSFFVGSVSILIGNGSGGFSAGNTLRTRTQPSAVVLRDLNTDGKDDMIVANFGSDSASTFFGNGAGKFSLSQNLAVGSGPVGLTTGRLDQNGSLDFATANYNDDSSWACKNNGSGIFNCQSYLPYGANPIAVTAGDFEGLGYERLAVAASGSNYVIVSTAITVGQNPNDVKTGDFNEDGKLDMVAVNYGSNDFTVMMNSCVVAVGNIFDFDGNRRTDHAIFRPSNRNWYIPGIFEQNTVFEFGRGTELLASADFDGDHRTDYAFYRPTDGLWRIRKYGKEPLYYLKFGLPEDLPVPADYDGDGKADIAVWRPSTGTWYLRGSADNLLSQFQLGSPGDIPAPADFDGDRIADRAVFRPSTGVWYIYRSSDGQYDIRQFGMMGDKVVPGDYDGDGTADLAVWRPSTGAWYVLRSSDAGFSAYAWGLSTDVPLIGDYDGDGKYDYGVWRPSDGIWYILKSSDGGGIYYPFGTAGDKPLPSIFIR